MQKDKRDTTLKISYDYDDDDDGGGHTDADGADACVDADADADADDDGDVYFSASKDVCGWVMSAEKEEHHQKRLQRGFYFIYFTHFFWTLS